MTDKSNRIYEATKAEVRSGRFAPGEPISATMLSRSFAASIIPVREALYRLVGERLIETRDNIGFCAPRVSEVILRDLYQAQLAMLLWALEQPGATQPGSLDPPAIRAGESSLAAVEGLFGALADTSGNGEVRWSLHNTIDRLHAVALLHDRVGSNWAAQRTRLLAAWTQGRQSFRDALLVYHERRIELVPALVEHLHRPSKCS